MKLTDAIATARTSGGSIARPGMDTFTLAELEDGGVVLTTGDILADNYTVVGVTFSISEAKFIEAYNSARAGFTSIKPFGESEFSRALLAAVRVRSVA